jgi:hypothetical protein
MGSRNRWAFHTVWGVPSEVYEPSSDLPMARRGGEAVEILSGIIGAALVWIEQL